MSIVQLLIDYVLHLDKYVSQLIAYFGFWTYGVVFLIILLETGVVILPFLPGDSLIFALGTFAAIGSLNIWLLFILLSLAAILGDTLNYWIGSYIGPKVFKSKSKWINPAHLTRTQKFFDKHGGKTIILARFIPILRTFAPFLAGVGKMNYWKFLAYNVVGGIAWVGIFVWGGYFFGNLAWVQANFHIVIIAIISISLVPVIFTIVQQVKERREKKVVRK